MLRRDLRQHGLPAPQQHMRPLKMHRYGGAWGREDCSASTGSGTCTLMGSGMVHLEGQIIRHVREHIGAANWYMYSGQTCRTKVTGLDSNFGARAACVQRSRGNLSPPTPCLGLIGTVVRKIRSHYLKGAGAEGHDYFGCACFVLSTPACIRCCRLWSQPPPG